jgi:hypothetical protein
MAHDFPGSMNLCVIKRNNGLLPLAQEMHTRPCLYPFSRTRICSSDKCISLIFPILIFVLSIGITYMEDEYYHYKLILLNYILILEVCQRIIYSYNYFTELFIILDIP